MSRAQRTGALLAALGSAAGAAAQTAPQQGVPSPAGSALGTEAGVRTDAGLSISASFDAWFPTILDPGSDLRSALGGMAQLAYAPLPFLQALARAGVYTIDTGTGASVLYVGGAAGLGFTARLFERVSVGLSGHAGLGRASYGEASSTGLYSLGARLEAGFRLSSSLTLGLAAGYERLANPNLEQSFMDAIGATLSLRLNPTEATPGRARLAIEKVDTQTIFPVFRSWYDAEPLGTVTVRNDEDGPVENVRVSFYAPAYMGGPRICATVKRIEKGQSAVVPLYAVFDERILKLTESGSTSAQIDVEYAYYGSKRSAKQGLDLSLHHRNAMSWEDDRRAAAFVSPTDPAALWFSRYAASVVRDRMRGDLPANLQYALGIFESLRLYGLNYVIDPNSAYVDMSENAAVIDYLQYPSQTLMYRGGDCDDLSILYCSLLEASGIPTAFITIPGHIYMAFDLGLSEAEARDRFFDPGLLLFRDGRAWAPIEITMVKEGFVKAWRVGAKQWIDNDRAGSAAFFEMRENWKAYRPSGLQDAQARFALPDEARAMAAFDAGVDRFVAREIEPVVAEYERRLASAREPATLNEYGTALAKVGMLDPAWERFVEASKAGYAWAWNNLASIAFVRKDYELAYSYYEWATSLLPGDPVAVLGMARCAYELDRYSEATILYEGLKEEAPALAARYGYLASAYGGTGRAWSMADRLAGSVWSRPGLSFSLPAAAPSVAAAAPSVPPPASVSPPTPIVVAPPAPPAAKAEAQAAAPVEAEPAIVAAPEPAQAVATTPEPEPTPVEPAPAIVAVPEPAQAVATTPEPEPAPVEPEPAIVAAPEPAQAVATTPEPEPTPVEPEKPTESATVRALAALRAQAAALKAAEEAKKATAQKPVAPTAIPAPPSLVERPPEDAEIAAKAAEAAAVAIEPPPAAVAIAPPSAPSPVAPPAVVERPPQDAEIVAKAAESAIVAVEAPQAAVSVTPPQAPVAVAQPPAPVAVPSAPAPASVAPPAPVTATPPPALVAVSPPQAPPPAPVAVTPAPAPASVAPPAPVTATPPPAPVAVSPPTPEPAISTPAIAQAVAPEPASRPTYAPAARFAPTVDRGSLPAFAKRLPEGADASGYERAPLPAITVAESLPAPRAVALSGPGTRVATGAWKRSESNAAMSDAKAMYAKLVVETPELAGAARYEFKGRATGSGWVGFGLHLHGRGAWRQSGYGGGDSILVWITSDPKAFGDSSPRLQVYRSLGEVDMRLVASERLAGSAFTSRAVRIDYDPAAGTLAVYVDGVQALSLTGLSNPAGSDYVALRALDLAEFADLTIAPLPPSSPTPETRP